MQNRDILGSWINANPRETMKLIWLAGWFIFQIPAMIIGFLFYWRIGQTVKSKFWWCMGGIVSVTLLCVILQLYWLQVYSLTFYLHYGWLINKQILLMIFYNGLNNQIVSLLMLGFNYTLGLSPLVALGLIGIDALPANFHKEALSALNQGKILVDQETKPETVIQTALAQLPFEHPRATILGVSVWTANPVIVPDAAVNQVVLVLGTTGGGKTVTLRRFFNRAIRQRYPLIIVDGKPTDENVAWVKALATQQGSPFYGFNCDAHHHYDPLAKGGHTELKDKIICLKDEWENDYYKSIAEDYLQTTIEILLSLGQPFDLSDIVACLSFDELVMRVRYSDSDTLKERIKNLAKYEGKDITGLQAHLNILLHSELGSYLKRDDNTFDLTKVVDENAVVYFALPALRFPSFSKVLGKLVVNDIKAVIDRYQGEKRIFTVFDEFSVFAGEQVLNLVNMGRGKGVHAIFGTQGLADLEKVDTTFKDQILNCANTLICHRLNDQTSAEAISNWVGTEDSLTHTAQINAMQMQSNLGSIRINKRFTIHPDEIKRDLATGEAFVVSKVGGFMRDKVRVKR